MSIYREKRERTSERPGEQNQRSLWNPLLRRLPYVVISKEEREIKSHLTEGATLVQISLISPSHLLQSKIPFLEHKILCLQVSVKCNTRGRVLCMSSSTVYILWWVSLSCRLFDACWLLGWEWLIRTTMHVPRIVYNQGRIAHRNICRQIRESPWQAIACVCIWAASLPQKMPADNTKRWMVKQSSYSELKQLFQILILAFCILSFFFICAVTNC